MDLNCRLPLILERADQLGHKLLLSGHNPGQQDAAVNCLGTEGTSHQLQRTGTGAEHQRRLILKGCEHIERHVHPQGCVFR